MPAALITGITGQDGPYLADLLLKKGYRVHGIARRTATAEELGLENGAGEFHMHTADVLDTALIRRILSEVAPDEVYHLAAQSHVGTSFEAPEASCEIVGRATLRLLEIIKALPRRPRFFYASSSEVFGVPETAPQNEETPFRPASPYGCAKAFATQLVRVYRCSHGLYAAAGILFNHESPRRGADFVTQKICRGAAMIKRGLSRELILGDTRAERDWGDARDYVRGMWLALQAKAPDDYVLATGQVHTVQDVVEVAFGAAGLDWKEWVRKDPKYLRPAEPKRLLGDPAKAYRKLGWRAERRFEETIREMTASELGKLNGNQV